MTDRMPEPHGETRQERRARKLAARRERIPKHGASLGHVYTYAVRRRAAEAGAGARPVRRRRSSDKGRP